MPPRRYGWDDARRLFWRLVLLGLIAAGLFVGAGMLLKPALPLGLPSGYQGQMLFLLMAAAAVGLAHVAAAFTERASEWGTFGFSDPAWRRGALARSFGGGALIVFASVGLLLLTGLAQVQRLAPTSPWPHLMQATVLALEWTFLDALLLRGYVFGAVQKRWGSWMAVGVTTVLGIAFTIAAGRMALAPVVSAIGLGVFLGAVRVRTQGLAAPWLAHVGIVWTQSAVLHMQVAPLALEFPPTYVTYVEPPALLTGAGYGIDGGLLCAALLVASAWWLMRDQPRQIAPLRV